MSILGLWVQCAALLLALPSVSEALFTGGGLTILSQNNLDGAPNDGTSAILVHQPTPFQSASKSCDLLGEKPWQPDTHNTTVVITSLQYQQYQPYQQLQERERAAKAGQFFWIAKQQLSNATAEECRAIDANGSITNINCLTSLPVLCTQTAPLSSSVSTPIDSSLRWRVVQSVNGTMMTGYRDLHTWKFRGVRFAEPPVRFGYAQKKTYAIGNSDVLAVDAGADCSQPIGEVKRGSSEDCLFANIWTPHLPRASSNSNDETSNLKPIMLYLYGGGFTSGSGKNPNTDGTNLASRGDVVVVSVNYRVGNTGFLAFDDGVRRGNYALSDMVAALEWVRDYARYFGGDASRVTLFGESAGAQATHILLGSPKAEGLFQRAIMQSDPQGYPRHGRFSWMQYDTVAESYQGRTTKVLEEAGCGNVSTADAAACLRKLSGFELNNLTTNVNGAVVDGVYLTEPWLVVNRTGTPAARSVSIMTGVNRDESGVLVDDYPAGNASFVDYFASKVGTHFGLPQNTSRELAHRASAAFGISASSGDSPADIFNASMAIATAGEFGCFDLAKAYSAARHSAFGPAYVYRFNRTYQTSGYTRPWCTPPKSNSNSYGNPDAEYFKCHAGEQMIVFGTEARAGLPDRDGHDVEFMQLIVDYWSAFARTGDPNPAPDYLRARGYRATLAQTVSSGPWRAVAADSPSLRLLQWNGAQVPFDNAERCAALGIPLDVLEGK